MSEWEVSAVPIAELVGLQDHEGSTVVIVKLPDGKELGLIFDEQQTSELSGALIERDRERPKAAAREQSETDADFHVAKIEELPPEEDVYVFRMASEGGGPFLTFRFGHRVVRRWRDMLTDQIVRWDRRSRN
ncbi:hypothetical protein [Bosea sp. (in: a-proteobacteria)]|jgi:hypothetical protein|uniref:hypothetical protein n=1 Tax=Bosea sp. (in: a-proteobacteria) TaxID=1871050 RepID=UPI003561CFF8